MLTTKERTEREKQRREIANTRMREKVAAARQRGICRCKGSIGLFVPLGLGVCDGGTKDGHQGHAK